MASAEDVGGAAAIPTLLYVSKNKDLKHPRDLTMSNKNAVYDCKFLKLVEKGVLRLISFSMKRLTLMLNYNKNGILVLT